MDIYVVNAVVAYDYHHTNEVLIFNTHQVVYINYMSNNSLCTIQLSMNEVKVFECPKDLTDNPG